MTDRKLMRFVQLKAIAGMKAKRSILSGNDVKELTDKNSCHGRILFSGPYPQLG
jgi:hypothetical protein